MWGTTFGARNGSSSGSYFYPRPPCGGRRSDRGFCASCTKFLSTSPVWGTTGLCVGRVHFRGISIHVPRVGDDAVYTIPRRPFQKFLSTSPVWGTTVKDYFTAKTELISIHVPRVGDDWQTPNERETVRVFLSTSPVWGTTTSDILACAHFLVFLSTSPVWGTTLLVCRSGTFFDISIHVPRVGDDVGIPVSCVEHHDFYPRPPCGGRQYGEPPGRERRCISIHVPRVGDDITSPDIASRHANFYPRPPCGGRLSMDRPAAFWTMHFYPRPPCGGRRH